MKRHLTTLFILIFGFAFGQDFSYPTISKQGNDIHSFIPKAWSLLDSAQGDLNNDQHNDLALIIQHTDSVSLIKEQFGENDTIITQPRVLLLLFYNPKTQQYQLAKQNNSFILNHDQPNMDEPYQDISISKGVLKIEFHIFMNAGGWNMSTNIYKFRFKDNDFVLIGADYNDLNRNSGEIEDRSYNFLTNKVKISTGTMESDKRKTVWRTLKLKTLKTLDTFTQPFTWEVEKDYFL